MPSQLDVLWSEFAAETEEHLDALERLLSDQRADWTRNDIGALFRYFHSLKGTFLAMGFSNVEALAHRCEDILSLVREGRSMLDVGLVKILLRSVDRLKDMREEVIAKRKDAKPAADILRELERHDQPQATANVPPPPADMPLSDDPEMLAIYSELMEQRLPTVAQALSLAAQDRAIAAETAAELAYGAEMMGFEAVAECLRAIAESTVAVTDQAGRDALIDRFRELRDQAKIIEEVTGVASGAAPLAASLATLLASDYAGRFAALSAAMSQLDHGAATADGMVRAAETMRAVALALGLEGSARLLVLIEERFRSVDLLDATRLAVVRELARDAIDALRSNVENGTDLEAQRADVLALRWEATFNAPASESFSETSAGQRLRPEVLATLSPEQRLRLETALNEGRRAYEVLLDLESNPEIAGDVIAWLSSAVETITSRTVYRNGANCFEFLIFSENPPEWIRSQLGALDPEQACLRGLDALGEAEQVAAGEGTAIPGSAPMRAPLIRVQSETIDELMAEVGEMRTSLAGLADIVQHGRTATAIRDARRFGRHQTQDADSAKHLDAMEEDLRELRTLEHALAAAHRRIWAAGLLLRVIPVDGLFGRLSRAARDLAQKLDKDIEVMIEGREVRIDKSMVDLLIDPLMHMVRNAVDHGIESPERRRAAGKPRRAKLAISAAEHSNRVEIVIADDGQGLDRAKILAKAMSLGVIAPHQAEQMEEQEITALIFRPGFSTADAVTEISGRGVGLDVVAAAVQRLGGSIDVETVLGAGTKFILKLPVSAALLRALLVEIGDQIFALPERQIVTVLELATQEIDEIAGQRTVIYRSAAVPVHRLATVLGFDTGEAEPELAHLAIVTTGTRMLALQIDRVLRFQDLFLKELHPMLAAVPVIAGASVLGDGRPVLVLDAAGLIGLGPANETAQVSTQSW
jgi:two-component system, chemotaxis family, sensor kinase CheA